MSCFVDAEEISSQRYIKIASTNLDLLGDKAGNAPAKKHLFICKIPGTHDFWFFLEANLPLGAFLTTDSHWIGFLTNSSKSLSNVPIVFVCSSLKLIHFTFINALANRSTLSPPKIPFESLDES